jgi:hypothetical protein
VGAKEILFFEKLVMQITGNQGVLFCCSAPGSEIVKSGKRMSGGGGHFPPTFN